MSSDLTIKRESNSSLMGFYIYKAYVFYRTSALFYQLNSEKINNFIYMSLKVTLVNFTKSNPQNRPLCIAMALNLISDSN